MKYFFLNKKLFNPRHNFEQIPTIIIIILIRKHFFCRTDNSAYIHNKGQIDVSLERRCRVAQNYILNTMCD